MTVGGLWNWIRLVGITVLGVNFLIQQRRLKRSPVPD